MILGIAEDSRKYKFYRWLTYGPISVLNGIVVTLTLNYYDPGWTDKGMCKLIDMRFGDGK